MSSYNPSFYSETIEERLTSDSFEVAENADVCIVGGGVAALSCAQTLTQSGYSVALFEADKVFAGASGLNGGMVTPGYSLGATDIERKVGRDHMERLFRLTIDGVSTISDNIRRYDIQSAHRTDGKITLLRYVPSHSEISGLNALYDRLNCQVVPVTREWLRETLASPVYQYGLLHTAGFHMHPLNYGVALARTLQGKGLKVVEGETVHSIVPSEDGYKLLSTSGQSEFQHVVVCTGGYASGEVPKLQRSIVPITTYVAVTEPNDDIPNTHIKSQYGFGDTRRASDYYRIVNGNQLLWGGRITAFPSHRTGTISNYIKHDILSSYPDIGPVDIKTAWSGLMGYASHKMPYIGRFQNGVWYCTAFGGRGLGAGTAGGQAVANAILGDETDVNLFRPFRLKSAFGLLGRFAVEATYKKYLITDHIKESKNNKNKAA